MRKTKTLFKLYPFRNGKEVEVVVNQTTRTYSFFLEGLFIRASFRDVSIPRLKYLIESKTAEDLEWAAMFDRLNEL